jgi:ornithine carbamoyltransferase
MTSNFLKITDFRTEEIWRTFEVTREIKELSRRGDRYEPLHGKTMAMIFAKPSARTRISFETGWYQLGGHAIYLSPEDIAIGKREAIKDIARLISRYNDLIMARLFSHDHIEELAEYSSVPVINGLTDYNHPCQVMADCFTILEHRGDLNSLKVAFIGDGNNVANSWINLASRIPMEFVLACPLGYEPDRNTIENAQRKGISVVSVVHDPEEAVRGADIVYTDVWASMGQEAEKEKRFRDFNNFQVNEELLALAKDDVKVMHCLPAHRGEEITDDVLEGPYSIVFDEAENRMHVQKAIVLQLLGFK